MSDIDTFFKRCDDILDVSMKGVTQRIRSRVEREFKHSGWVYHSFSGDGFEMLDTLSNPALLINDDEYFNRNFALNLRDMVPSLKDNKTWQSLLPVLVGIKEKGVGVGELVLPFIVPGWSYSNDGDGFHGGGYRECKNGVGSSIKPIKGGLTAKGLIDKLNKKYWNGVVPGHRKTFREWLSEFKSDISVSTQYFKELYPKRDVSKLVSNLMKVDTREDFHKVMGRHHLSWYQEVDGWKSILLIHESSLNLINLSDIDESIFDFNIKMNAVMKRGKGTQAVPDGYSNIKTK